MRRASTSGRFDSQSAAAMASPRRVSTVMLRLPFGSAQIDPLPREPKLSGSRTWYPARCRRSTYSG